MSDLIPKHGGYRKLKSFQVAQLVYDVTARFAERYVDRFSRTKDQMVQAARSGVAKHCRGIACFGDIKKGRTEADPSGAHELGGAEARLRRFSPTAGACSLGPKESAPTGAD